MAFIDDIYVHVTSETETTGVKLSQHPVENGFNITDSISPEPVTLKLKGEIVPSAKEGSQSRFNIILAALEQKCKGGALITYTGATTLKNAVIENFDTTYTSAIAGGCAFSMTIREIRVAAPAYVVKGNSSGLAKVGTQQVKKNAVNTYHIVKIGDTLWALSVKYYGDGAKFNLIYAANKRLLKTPGTTLQTGWQLHIP